MAGSLIKIDEEIVTSAVASVTLTGIDSTYDVYMVTMSGMQPASDAQLYARVTTGGVADSDSEYDFAAEYLKSDTTFGTYSATNLNNWIPTSTMENAYGGYSLTMYLFNFNNSSEYSFITSEEAHIQSGTTAVRGLQGGGVHTVAEANDGISFLMGIGNINSGKFVMYGLKK